MHSPTRFRACRLEPLENRCLLSLTVITHGRAPDGFPDWVYSMGAAIARRADSSVTLLDDDGDRRADAIENVKYDLAGNHPSVGDGKMSPHVLLFDWVERSTALGSANEPDVAGKLREIIHERLVNVPAGQTLDLHFIGHSRGYFVNAQAIRLLATDSLVDRIGFLQMTSLDPQAEGTDGALEFNPGGIVDFTDNYFQGASVPIGNNAIPWALNFDLTDIVRAWDSRPTPGDTAADNHSEVHDWYHWTITTYDAPALDVPAPDRSILYNNTRRVNLDRISGADDWAHGANIGYYFSLTGGGIGTVIQTEDGELYTVDTSTGKKPLFLGSIRWDTWDIAYNPRGELFAIDTNDTLHANTVLYKIDLRFGFFNTPAPRTTTIGNLGVTANALVFRSDGLLVAAGNNLIFQVDTTSGHADTLLTLPPQYESSGDLAFDDRGNLYLTEQNGHLLMIRPDLTQLEESRWLGYRFTHGLVYRDGILYIFREDGEFYEMNLEDGSSRSRGFLDGLPNGSSVAGAATAIAPPTFPWHNSDNPRDVNGDGVISGRDALNIINSINADGSRRLIPPPFVPLRFFYDVNRDGRITAQDALWIINHLNARAAQPQMAALQAADTSASKEASTQARAVDEVMYLMGLSADDANASLKKRRQRF